MEIESHLFKNVKKYLEELGYPPESISEEYLIEGTRNRIDIVVKKEKGIYLAVDVKNPKALNFNSIKDIEYHPLTRKIQKEAQEVNAEYFLLTNGHEYLWMKTGIGGRPEKVNEVPYSDFNIIKNTEKQFFNIVLSHVFEYLRSFPITGNVLYDISLILYIKLKKEIAQNFDIAEIEFNHFSNNELRQSNKKQYSNQEIILDAIERLENVNLLENNLTAIEFIDKLFLKNSKDLVIPRWIADLMVKILNPSKQDNIVDLFARNGSISSSAYFNGIQNVLSYYTNNDYYFWIKIQQLLFLKIEHEIILEPSLCNVNFTVFGAKIPDSFLIAPPFNLKINDTSNSELFYMGIKDSTSIFIEKALKCVKDNGKVMAIVPDSFLSSNQYLKVRKLFSTISQIESIISLPQDTFRPFSSVKTSIITFVKTANKIDTFFASIEESPAEYTIDCTKFESINEILNNYKKFKSLEAIVSSKLGFIVKNIDVDNLHFSRYLFTENLYEENSNGNYIFVPLKELSIKIFKGAGLINDEKGSIPYIAPASVRKMRIIKDALSYTSQHLIPKQHIKIELNNILINAIGPNRGKAAIVTADYVSMPINRHIIGLKVNKNLVIPEYLAIALNSRIVQEQFLDKSSGAVIPALNLKSLEEIIIPLPNVEIQEKLVEEFTSLSTEFESTLGRLYDIESRLNARLNILGKEGDII